MFARRQQHLLFLLFLFFLFLFWQIFISRRVRTKIKVVWESGFFTQKKRKSNKIPEPSVLSTHKTESCSSRFEAALHLLKFPPLGLGGRRAGRGGTFLKDIYILSPSSTTPMTLHKLLFLNCAAGIDTEGGVLVDGLGSGCPPPFPHV